MTLKQRILAELQELEKIPQSYEVCKKEAGEKAQERKRRFSYDPMPSQEKQKYLDGLLNYNESFYYGPAKAAIDMTNQAILEAESGNTPLAKELFTEAYENFEHPALLFNLGKFLLESDDPDGLIHLLNYALGNQQLDWHSAQLHSLFNICNHYPILSGEFGEYVYRITLDYEQRDVEELDIQPYLQGYKLNLPYKIPLSLNLEPHSNALPSLEDYDYICELSPCEPGITELEIKVPLEHWRTFLEEFEGVIYDLSESYEAVFDFEKVFWNELKLPKYLSPDSYDPSFMEPAISLIRARMQTEHSHELVQMFGEFMLKHTERFLSDGDSESMLYAEQPPEEYYISEEYDQFYTHNEKKYAILSACLHNIEQGAKNPFLFLDHEVYKKARSKFRKMFAGIAHILEPEDAEDPSESKLSVYWSELDRFCAGLRNRSLADAMENEVRCILNVILHQPVSTLQHMRRSLEILVNEVYFKIHRIPTHDTLNSIINMINRRHNKYDINSHMYNIRKTANKHLHYDKSIIAANGRAEPLFTKEEAFGLLDGLFVTMHFFADVYDL